MIPEPQNELPAFLINAFKQIDSASEAEIKTDMKRLLSGTYQLLLSEDETLFTKEHTPMQLIGKIVKLVTSIGSDFMTAQVSPRYKRKMEERFKDIIALGPVFKKYSEQPALSQGPVIRQITDGK